VKDYRDLLSLPVTAVEREVIDALVKYGSQNAAAEGLGYKRTRVQSALRRVQARQRAATNAVSDADRRAQALEGHVSTKAPMQMGVKPGTTVARYVLTSAQNNTRVHEEFLCNLEAYAEHIGAEIMISRYSYNKAAFGAKSTKAGRAPTAADTQGLWYDPRIEQYVCDDPDRHGSCRYQLAPDLMWCAEMNILPTAIRPLSGLESYAGTASGIFPHAKIALESVPVIGDRPPKINYTTGTCTQRNYIAKKEGLKGEFHHCYSALIVEVETATGEWWVRQLNANEDGSFQDLNFAVEGGVITNTDVLAVNWGDVHAVEIDPAVAIANWGAYGERHSHGRLGVIDFLRPAYQFWHDTGSFAARGHHEIKVFSRRLEKHVSGGKADLVEAEIDAAADLLQVAHRDWCTTVIVSSNHDRHGERWLDEADYRQDLPNAAYFLEAQLARVRAIQAGEDWDFLQWALIRAECASPTFCKRDSSFKIGPPGHEIECGQHGDEGPDGARGNTANLSRMATRINKGHDHKATIRDGVYSAGVCNRRLPYAHGPSSWSVSHIVTYPSGKRAIITMRCGKYWA
jgi:hypothetical protein